VLLHVASGIARGFIGRQPVTRDDEVDFYYSDFDADYRAVVWEFFRNF
jgi:hypothetical protein